MHNTGEGAATITFSTPRGTVTYTTKAASTLNETGAIASGLLGGEPTLVMIVQGILTGNLPTRVRVAEPDIDYEFTPGRDTLADVAAAMLAAGNGKGRLSDTGWQALDFAMEWAPETRGPAIRQGSGQGRLQRARQRDEGKE